MLAAPVQTSLAEAGCPERGGGLIRVGEVGVHPSPDECRQNDAEGTLGGTSVLTGEAEVRQVSTLRKRLESAGEAVPLSHSPRPSYRLITAVVLDPMEAERLLDEGDGVAGPRRVRPGPV